MNRTNAPRSTPQQSSNGTTQAKGEPTLQIRPRRYRDSNLLVNLSTGTRLTLSFILAALIAAIVVGAIGIQRSQSLTNQSQFYQNLLRINTSLTTGAQDLQLMRAETQSILAQLTSPQISQETLNQDELALVNLSKRYDDILTQYIKNDQLVNHPHESALLLEANHGGQINQQGALSSSSLRTWRVYQSSITQLLALIKSSQAADALHFDQFQIEPTNADALSALRALIQFDSKLATSVQDAALVEQQSQYITTIISSVIAFIAIMLIGWIISGTIVRRLNRLRDVTRDVEQGQLNRRVMVIGRDEIAEVSASVNAMLEAIVGLLEETRHQRDALTNAAEHLFSNMRVVSAGDLRVNAPVSNDPIGMLANAFNFTVGRFRRFVQRTRTIAEQLDVIAHQEIERAEKFTQSTLSLRSGLPGSSGGSLSQTISRPLTSNMLPQPQAYYDNAAFQGDLSNGPGMRATQSVITSEALTHVQDIREQLQPSFRGGIIQQTRSVVSQAEQLSLIVERLNRLIIGMAPANIRQEEMRKRILEELRALDGQLKGVTMASQSTQSNLVKTMQELDQELATVSSSLRVPVASGISTAAVSRMEPDSRELPLEWMQLSAAMTSDIIVMARQLSSLAQEIRTGIISFQLDTEGNTGLLNTPATPTSTYNLASDLRRPGSIP